MHRVRLRAARAAAVPCVAAIFAMAFAATSLGGCERSPEIVTEHLVKGDRAFAEGRYTEALVAYGHAREMGPQDPRVQLAMMKARVFVMAESPARVGAESLDDVRYEALFLMERDRAHEAVYLTALGNVLARRGDVDGARAKLGEAIKSDPLSAAAHASLGALYAARPEARGDARAELELALKSKPDTRDALLGLGQLALADGDASGAVTRLEAALRLGDDAAVRMALGAARRDQQRPAEAAAHFQRAAELDPRSADALSALGQAWLTAGQLDDAERALRGALTLRRDAPTAIALGFALTRQKKAEQALSVFQPILAEAPASPSALYGAGVASEDLGRADQALLLYRRLLSLPPEPRRDPVVADLQRDAQARAAALSTSAARAAPSASASAAAPPRR